MNAWTLKDYALLILFAIIVVPTAGIVITEIVRYIRWEFRISRTPSTSDPKKHAG